MGKIIRQNSNSRQPRFSKEDAYKFYTVISRWVDAANLTAPQYGRNSRIRDEWLRVFWKQEPHLAGVLNSVVAIDKNRGWNITGGRNQVLKYSRILRDADDGTGWRRYIARQSLSFYTADVGAITEVGTDIEGGTLTDLYNVDPARCDLTGSIVEPLRYYPSSGVAQLWDKEWFFRTVSMESTDETLNGLGYCAVSRILELATIMVAVYRHDQEKLLARLPKGLLLMQGIMEDQWETAMNANAERLTAKEREYYGGLSIFFGDDSLDAKLVALSNLPDGFELETVTNLLMSAYALALGYDTSEFWPVKFGALGRGTEAQVQALKASGKGGLDFVLGYQDNLQMQLPSTLLFEFEQRNELGEELEAQVAEAWAKAIQEMAAPSGSGMPPTLTIDEKRYLLASRGLIPEDWTLQEEDTTITDTDPDPNVNERLLDSINVRRAMYKFPDEQIVSVHWPSMTERVIYDPNERNKLFMIERSLNSYFSAIRGAARSYRREDITRANFRSLMEGNIELNLNQAWRDGAATQGFTPEDFNEEDDFVIDGIIRNEFTFISGFADFIESMREEPAGALDFRIQQWANRWQETLERAKAHFGGNKKLEWVFNPEKENCEDCARLDGQVRRAKFWEKKDLHPLSMQLQCGPGRQCGCELTETDKPVNRGRLPKIVGPG